MTLFELNYHFIDPIFKYSHILGYCGLGLRHMNLDGCKSACKSEKQNTRAYCGHAVELVYKLGHVLACHKTMSQLFSLRFLDCMIDIIMLLWWLYMLFSYFILLFSKCLLGNNLLPDSVLDIHKCKYLILALRNL